MALAIASLSVCASPVIAAFKDQIGFTQLQSEYPNLPTGHNLAILEIEFAVDWTNFNWAVAPGGELAGRSLTYFPAGTNPTGFSNHANGVASILAGSTTSIIPQVPSLISTVESAYITAALHIGEAISPSAPTWNLESTTSCWNDPTWSVEILRRLDWRVDQQGITFVAVVLNGAPNSLPYVFSSAYNVITVGVTAGTHSSGDTLIEGVGRIKPDIVGPDDYTSGATPIVASCAGLLIDQAKADVRFAVAKDPRVIKALLLAGATKQEIPGWSNSSTQPLDAHFGAGQVNIANSYRMLMSGRQPAGNAWLSGTGWDTGTSGTGRYFIEVPAGQTATFSTVLTWHRTITPNANWSVLTPSLADLNLRLSTASADFSVGTLVAESRSAIDNVEHVYQASLPAGRYVLEVTGPAGVSYGIAWRSNLVDLGPPTFTTQPQNRIVTAGLNGIFIAVASGYPATSYQWQRLPAGSGTWANVGEGGSYSGSTSTVLAVSNAAVGMSADQFRCVATNTAGSATSAAATLTIGITAANPITSQTVTNGHSVTFSAGNTGGALQWQISTDGGTHWTNLANDNTYSGVNTATLTIGNAQAFLNNTEYHYVATGNNVVATSNAATLTVVQAFFPFPTSIARDSTGNLYVSDSNTNTVQKITPSGQVSLVAGTNGSAGSADGTGTAARFNQPAGLALTAQGVLYLADTANATIRRIGADAVVTTLAGSPSKRGNGDGTGTAATFSQPIGVALDSSGTLVVADSMNHTIRKVSAAGVVTTWAGTAGVIGTADGNGTAARFNLPTGIAVDASGNVHVADTTDNTVRAITPAGAVTTLAGLAGVSGSTDGNGAAALFNRPGALAVDPAGNIYLADTGNSVIRKITPAGTVTTLAGLPGIAGLEDGPGSNALFNQPMSLTLDSAGNLYVADSGNAAIRKITAAGAVTTLALSAAPDPAPPPTPTPPPSSSSGGTPSGGGGGAIDGWLAGLLSLLLLSRRNWLRT
jgi:hypothetical protein